MSLPTIAIWTWLGSWFEKPHGKKKGFSPGTQQNCSLIKIPLCLSCAWGAGPLSWLAGTLCPEDANPHSECPKCWRQTSGKQKETWGSTCAWQCVCFLYQNQLVHYKLFSLLISSASCILRPSRLQHCYDTGKQLWQLFGVLITT